MYQLDLSLEFLIRAISNPQFIQGIEKLFAPPCHTAYDVAQDALDAAEHGKMSNECARKVVNSILDDLDSQAGSSGRSKRITSHLQALVGKGKLSFEQAGVISSALPTMCCGSQY